MNHKMKLLEEPFERIKSGKKKIEVRLFDEKRRGIRVGDIIEFVKLPDSREKILVRVKELRNFKSFLELYSEFDNYFFGKSDFNVDEEVSKMRKIYSEKDEKKFGVLGIRIELVD